MRWRNGARALGLVLGAYALLAGGALTAQQFVPLRGFEVADGSYVPATPDRLAGDTHPLNLPFPEMPGTAENPITPESATLGRMLFFDPILSGSNRMSCATCHHPDFGWADARPLSMGLGGEGLGPERTGGATLRRHAPTLWNTGFSHAQFWDGRAPTLEEQAAFPIMAPDEMNQDPSELLWELGDIPQYVAMFEAAYPDDDYPLSFDNVLRAVATFQRTLVSYNAPYDRYVMGDHDALSAKQKRGLAVFRSKRAGCMQCHHPPTFAGTDFRVIGVPDPANDPGVAQAPGGGPEGGFKVPTLRNITETAPYMHNGAFATLEEVIDFYANGAGWGAGMDHLEVDPRVADGFALSAADREALIAFLHALTDTSNTPEIPPRVPSGLPVERAAR